MGRTSDQPNSFEYISSKELSSQLPNLLHAAILPRGYAKDRWSQAWYINKLNSLRDLERWFMVNILVAAELSLRTSRVWQVWIHFYFYYGCHFN